MSPAHSSPPVNMHASSATPSSSSQPAPATNNRRNWLRRGAGLAALGAVGTLALGGQRARAEKRPLTLSWTGTGLCLSPILVAKERGFFKQNGADVEIISFAGSVDQTLESLATGKADLSLGLIHAWLKPLESGFDVKVVGAAHAGCLRVLAPVDSGIDTVEAVKGKTIGVGAIGGPGRQFFSTYLARHGVDPERDVQWRAYAPDTLDLALKKGEIDVISDSDPNLYLIEQRNPGRLRQIASILDGDFKDRLCCIIAARGPLVRERPQDVAAVVRSLQQASLFIADNPGEAARVVYPYLPRAPIEDLRAIFTALGYRHHPRGPALQGEIEAYARDLQQVGVIKKSTDPARFAQHLTVDVLG